MQTLNLRFCYLWGVLEAMHHRFREASTFYKAKKEEHVQGGQNSWRPWSLTSQEPGGHTAPTLSFAQKGHQGSRCQGLLGYQSAKWRLCMWTPHTHTHRLSVTQTVISFTSVVLPLECAWQLPGGFINPQAVFLFQVWPRVETVFLISFQMLLV